MKKCNDCKEAKELSEFYSQIKNSVKKGEYIYYSPYCKECSILRSQKYQQENHDKSKKYWRDRFNNLYKTDSSIRERQKNNQKKRENKYQQQKEWQQNNPEKLKQYRIERAVNKKHDISKEEWKTCKEYFSYECAYCGISEKDAKSKYKNNLHKDHANPLGLNDISNCIPACKSCNSTKHDSELFDWYCKDLNKNFTVERKAKIDKWLQEDYLLVS